ncbi:MAG: DNA primase, partial [Deltaproteobacteria bacterium]
MSPSDVATLVKQAVDIVDVVGQVVPLRRAGNRHVGICPFHKEKTPSFHVDSENQFYYCFGCGSGGDVFSFVMKHQNVTFGDALKYLAERYHIALPEKEYADGASRAVAEVSRKERQELYSVLKFASDYFYGQLHHGEKGRIAKEYLAKRALPDDVVETEKLGYATPDWDGLLRHMEKAGVDLELGVKAGLLAKSSKDENRLYDRFRNRLIFPIKDDHGQFVAFGGRSLSSETQDEPKYLNSPETSVYHKGRMLYQLPRAREACRQVRQVVLVEGYMDLLAFHAQGFYRVVATLGTALTVHQVRLLSRFTSEVVLSYDGDEAGERAMLRALPIFLQEELPVSCVRFPEGMDPDDFLKTKGLPAFEALVDQRYELGTYSIRKTLEGWDGSTGGKANVLTELQPLFEVVRQPLLISEYLRLISDRLSLSEEVIQKQLRHGRRQSAKHSSLPESALPAKMVHGQPSAGLEDSILRVMVKYPALIEEVNVSGALDYFQESRIRSIAQVLVQVPRPPHAAFDAASVYESLPDPEQKELFSRFLLESGDLSEARLHIQDWLEALCERRTKRERSALTEALRQAERNGDEARVRHILLEIQNLCSVKKRLKDSPE